MVSLWGSKNGEERTDTAEEENGRDSESRQPPRHSGGSEPDERTRLLPPPRNDGYLDPDDPAVSGNQFQSLPEYIDSCHIGLSLQSMERTGSPLFLRPFLRHQLPMVGITPGLNLRQPANDALAWFWILRLFLHHPYYR